MRGPARAKEPRTGARDVDHEDLFDPYCVHGVPDRCGLPRQGTSCARRRSRARTVSRFVEARARGASSSFPPARRHASGSKKKADFRGIIRRDAVTRPPASPMSTYDDEPMGPRDMSINVPRSVTDARNTLSDLHELVRRELDGVVVGYDEPIELLLVAAVCGGHVLIEGPPGIAKTLMAGSVARVLGVGFKRVQFTPDTLPEEITGRERDVRRRDDVPPGRRVHEHPPRRRDQPHAAAHAGRAPRGDAGAARDGRGTHPLAAVALHGDRDPESLRAGRDLPAPGVPARPVPVQDPPRLRLGRSRARDPPAAAPRPRPRRSRRRRAAARRHAAPDALRRISTRRPLPTT